MVKKPKELLHKNEINNDKICLKCKIRGRCCHYHQIINGRQVETDDKCFFLMKNGLCSIYKVRQLYPHCHSIEFGIEHGNLLAQCEYVKDDSDYLIRRDRRITRELIIFREEDFSQ